MTNDVARLNLIEDMLVSRAKSTYSKRDREPVEAALEAFRRLRAMPKDADADAAWAELKDVAGERDELRNRVEYLDWVAMVREVHLETAPEILRDTPGIPAGGLYANYGLDFIKEEVKELEQANHDFNLVEMVDALADIVYVSIRASLMLGVDLRPVFREVHRAMKTKYEGGLLKREDGKVLKGPNYVPPDIASVLDAQKGGAFD